MTKQTDRNSDQTKKPRSNKDKPNKDQIKQIDKDLEEQTKPFFDSEK